MKGKETFLGITNSRKEDNSRFPRRTLKLVVYETYGFEIKDDKVLYGKTYLQREIPHPRRTIPNTAQSSKP